MSGRFAQVLSASEFEQVSLVVHLSMSVKGMMGNGVPVILPARRY